LVLAAVGCSGGTGTEDEAGRAGIFPRHNVVVVSVDTLRADHVTAYGYEHQTTPNIDRLAREGIVFERAFAPRGHTWPSLTSMWTSLYPRKTNVRGPGELPDEGVRTLASVLDEAGYESAAFLANFCRPGRQFFRSCLCGDDQEVTEKAISWLAHPREEPFLLWLHLMRPHTPYQPDEAHDRFTTPSYGGTYDGSKSSLADIYVNQRPLTQQEREHLVGLYDGEVLWADSYVGQFYQAMEREGYLDRSILVFTSDHGEDLYDRHRHFGHGCSIYDSVLHVPLIFRLPGARLAGARLDAVVGLVDLVPTILDVLGIERQGGFDGESLFSLLFSAGKKHFPAVISEHYRRRQAGEVLSIRTKRWRYIYNQKEVIPYCVPPTALYRIAKEELYDHRSDPLETRNVAESFPEVTRRLRERLLTHYPLGERERPANMATDAETLERLRSLGYIAE